ncbi:MAG TPA: hypothetical protein ENF89_01340, partial [Candidatus Bathyarchaeota archaeon]|nr:hypothetical protein [Candidatus Bathyarchaeota archaeon]
MPKGWLLDAVIEGPYATLWLRDDDGHIVKLRQRFRPHIYAKPKRGISVEELCVAFREHSSVYEAESELRYASLSRRKQVEVARIIVESADEIKKVEAYGRELGIVEEFYDDDPKPIQWYLYRLGIPPWSHVEWRSRDDILTEMRCIDEELRLEPPPFKPLIFKVPIEGEVKRITVKDTEGDLTLEGSEERVLEKFQAIVEERDPDLLMADDVDRVLRNLIERAEELGLELSLGRMGERKPKGRVSIDLRAYEDYGLTGLEERGRFALAPVSLCHSWAPGRLVDSRHCYEAWRLGILVPSKRGGYGYISTALDLIHSDRGGLVLSPKVGLHENIGVLDFESMFPNIIVRHNVSYETVGPEAVEQPGFLPHIVKGFLERRLYFKHLRDHYPEGSRERLWCEQRQLALKLILVCVYGYSGCPVNRFAYVKVFQEINRRARETLVKSMNIAMKRGFEVIYGDSDSLFVKRPNATKEDYEALAREIEMKTGLPIKFERHFRFLVLLPRAS